MFEVHNAIHIRTGQRAAGEALDAWLAQHDVDVVAVADAYDACIYLLRHYDRVPDLVLIGTDWLAPDEYNIVSYVRQTWPPVGLVLYGNTGGNAVVELLPMTRMCGTEADLRRLLDASPADVLRDLHEETGPVFVPPRRPAARADDVPARPSPVPGDTRSAPPEADDQPPASRRPRPALKLGDAGAPGSIMTAEELSALLDGPDEG